MVGGHGNDGVVEDGAQGNAHFLAVIPQLHFLRFASLGLADVVGICETIPPAQGIPGKNLDSFASLLVDHAPIQGFPPFRRAEYGGLRVLEHDQGDIARAVCGVIPLHIQVLHIQFRVTGDLLHSGVLQGDGVLPVCLHFRPPLGVLLGLFRDDRFQICHNDFPPNKDSS